MTPGRLRRLAYAASLATALAIAVLTLMPAPSLPNAPGGDKLHHFLAFAALVFPVVAVRPRAGLWMVPGAILFGGAIELIQPHVGRHGEWADVLANATGALIGAALAWAVHGAWRGLLRRG